jgi:nitrogen regulatory protein PII
MKKLECIFRAEKLETVKDTLARLGDCSMTVSQVVGCGLQRGWKEVYRGIESNINLLPKVKVEIVVSDEQVDEVAELVCQAARTGEIGDGKIFIYPVANAIRIRTGEHGDKAIQRGHSQKEHSSKGGQE